MGRLFIDCDDTLVLWLNEESQPIEGQNPYGGGATKWEPNAALLAAIKARREEFSEVVVWSGGGRNYADVWRMRILPTAEHAEAKDLRLPQVGDLCVDDATLRVACPLVTWQEFVRGGQE